MSENDENISESLRNEIETDYKPITPIIYSSLESAHQLSGECLRIITERTNYQNEFPEIAQKINRAFYPTLMRAITQYLLKLQNIKTNSENWMCDVLINNGLAGEFSGREYKILKIYRKHVFNEQSGKFEEQLKIPPPGYSRRRLIYFGQLHRQQYIWDIKNTDVVLPKHNAFYLWDTPTPEILNLYLACSKSCSVNQTEEYFIHQIQHPIFDIKPVPNAEDIFDDIKLDIELPKLDFGQTPQSDKTANKKNESDNENGDQKSDENNDLRE